MNANKGKFKRKVHYNEDHLGDDILRLYQLSHTLTV